MIPENGSTSLTADSPFIYPSNFFQETIFRVCLTVFKGVVCLEVQIPMLQLPSSSIKPPSQKTPPPPPPSSPISLPPFSQGKKVLTCNPPLPFPWNDRLFLSLFYDCNTSRGLILSNIFIHILKFEYVFVLQLHDLQLYVPELFHFCFSLCGVLIPSSYLNQNSPASLSNKHPPPTSSFWREEIFSNNGIEIHVDQNFIYKKISTFSVIETVKHKQI